MKILSRSHFSLSDGLKTSANCRAAGVLAITVVHPDAGKRCRTAHVSAI